MAASPPYQVGKLIAILGMVLLAVGLLLMAGSRLGFLNLGRLPGDIAYKGRRISIYFPVVTCLVLSVIVMLILWLVSWLRRP